MNVVLDAIPFIEEHTRCNPWSAAELAQILQKSIADDCLLWTHEASKIVGLAFGIPLHPAKTVYILGVTIHPDHREELLPYYLKRFRTKYPSYIMKGKRHGYTKELDYERILQKLS
jgi:hypothetical protein